MHPGVFRESMATVANRIPAYLHHTRVGVVSVRAPGQAVPRGGNVPPAEEVGEGLEGYAGVQPQLQAWWWVGVMLDQLYINITTGETSQTITPFHFFQYFNFFTFYHKNFVMCR